MMHVRVRADIKGAEGTRDYQPGFLLGSRFYTPADGPFEVDKTTAERLIKQGLAEAVVQVPPAQAPTERAVAPKPGAQKR
jgi:hypothetical protein